jgi:phage gp36-like protein
MAYATQAQVLAEFKDLTVGASTPISTSDIAAFIADADAEINSRLSVKYTTPITGSESLIMMKMISVWLIKHRINEILAVKTGTSQTSQEGSKSYRQMAMDLLNDLASGKAKLTDATLATSADGVKSYTYTNSIEHVFDLEIDQW